MPKEEMKFWVIRVSYTPQCTEEYGAWATKNPLEEDLLPEDFYAEAEQSLWDSYGYVVTGWDDEYVEGDTEEERDECRDQMYEDFRCEIGYECEEDEDALPSDYSIVYDERNND